MIEFDFTHFFDWHAGQIPVDLALRMFQSENQVHSPLHAGSAPFCVSMTEEKEYKKGKLSC